MGSVALRVQPLGYNGRKERVGVYFIQDSSPPFRGFASRHAVSNEGPETRLSFSGRFQLALHGLLQCLECSVQGRVASLLLGLYWSFAAHLQAIMLCFGYKRYFKIIT